MGGTECVLGMGHRMSVRGCEGVDKKISYARGRKGGGGAGGAPRRWGAPPPNFLRRPGPPPHPHPCGPRGHLLLAKRLA
jgi:hypothetical protein